jgi:hypothetical protein
MASHRFIIAFIQLLVAVLAISARLTAAGTNFEIVQTKLDIRRDPSVAMSLELAGAHLKFRGALVLRGLSSNARLFDGISAAEVDPKNGNLILFADRRGTWIRLSMHLNNGEIDHLKYLDQGIITYPRSNPLKDIESVTWHKDRILVGRDKKSEILSLANDFDEVSTFVDLKNWLPKGEDGIEAMTNIPSLGILCIAELQPAPKAWIGDTKLDMYGVSRKNTRVSWLVDPSTKVQRRLAFVAHEHYDPGGLATLSNGDVVVVHKNYYKKRNTLYIVRVSKTSLKKVKAESPNIVSVLRGHVILEAISSDPTDQVFDNTEAVAAFKREGREYIILISDNNQKTHPDQKVIVILLEMRQ